MNVLRVPRSWYGLQLVKGFAETVSQVIYGVPIKYLQIYLALKGYWNRFSINTFFMSNNDDPPTSLSTTNTNLSIVSTILLNKTLLLSFSRSGSRTSDQRSDE